MVQIVVEKAGPCLIGGMAVFNDTEKLVSLISVAIDSRIATCTMLISQSGRLPGPILPLGVDYLSLQLQGELSSPESSFTEYSRYPGVIGRGGGNFRHTLALLPVKACNDRHLQAWLGQESEEWKECGDLQCSKWTTFIMI